MFKFISKRFGNFPAVIALFLLSWASIVNAQDETERLFWQSVDCGDESQVQAYIQSYPQGAYMDQALQCIGADAGQQASKTSSQLNTDASKEWIQILSGKWGSSSGKHYDLKAGDFYRGGYINMRLACEVNTEKKTITPIYNCSGDWYNSNGEAGGAYQGKLYFYQGKKWYLEGKNNYFSSPDSWYGWDFSKLEDAVSDSNTTPSQVSSLDWPQILNGKWGSSTGKHYDLKTGDFYRGGYINMRLACELNTQKKTITPIYNCSGDWYNSSGEAGGAYQGELYFYQGKKWYLEGKSNYFSDPDSWYGWDFSQIIE